MRAGVIGVGHLGQHHARIYSELEDITSLAIFDTDKERTSYIARKFNGTAYNNLDDFLFNVDIVSIASPTQSHHDYAAYCLDHKKHILVEKPICSTLHDAKDIVQLQDRTGMKCQVGHIERFNPAIIALSSVLLRPAFIEANRLAPFTPRGSDVPVVYDIMIHDIDIILSLVQSRVKEINAVGVPILTNDIDIANAKIEFENGTLANITSSRISLKKERKIRFFQKDMYISLDYQDKQVRVVRKNPQVDEIMKEIMNGTREANIYELYRTETLPIIEKEPLRAEIESFISSIVHDNRPIVNAQDGYEALRVAYTIMEDIEKNRRDLNLR
ncbi:MAG TPA: Gfo/Idh/MocA family oxidoreductase [Candidatus Cloacimonetes bacterium]|nr:Gfo/Idh/MocA family oxidoreductase [Candidatus Cloacimonadota bacterium]HEX37837.1 Gfo/Idh/MocA family oxidoreductase [Candidatus Cloacimonadota bacterium]